jgi:hypothetical protein
MSWFPHATEGYVCLVCATPACDNIPFLRKINNGRITTCRIIIPTINNRGRRVRRVGLVAVSTINTRKTTTRRGSSPPPEISSTKRLAPALSSSKGATIAWSALSGDMVRAIWKIRSNHPYRVIPASMSHILSHFSWSAASLLHAVRSTCHSRSDLLAFRSSWGRLLPSFSFTPYTTYRSVVVPSLY